MATVQLRFLGGFSASTKFGGAIAFPTKKAKALVAYLGNRPGRTHSRAKLATLLWGNSGDAQARDSLRQALASIRKTLREQRCSGLDAKRDMVSFDPAVFESDVVVFRSLCDQATPDSLYQATAFYDGDFLDGFYLVDREFDEWANGERAQLNELLLHSLESLLAHCASTGDAEHGIPIGIRLLTLDRLQESVHRVLMQFYLQQGRRGAALQQYQDCQNTLRDELNISPTAETEALQRKIHEMAAKDEQSKDRATAQLAPAEAKETVDTSPRNVPSEKPSIAVLPFVNLSGDQEQEYFSDGITEDIIATLSRLHWFLVIARNSSFVYKNRVMPVGEIGHELGVRYILQGSVRKVGNNVRVATQLVDAATGTNLWAQKYDRELTNIFAVQDEIAESVTSTIEPRLVIAEAAHARRRSFEELDAWDLVMRALWRFWRMTTIDSEVALEMLRSAVERYPNYGPAHSLLAFALAASGSVGWISTWPQTEDVEYVAALARRGAKLDPEDPWAHLALGFSAFTRRSTDEAEAEFRLALELNPNFATAYGYLGWALAFDGQSEAARANFEQALRMSPHDPLKAFFFSGTGVTHYFSQHFEDAAEWARRAIQLRPDFIAAHRILCAALAQAGKTDETAAAMARLRQLQPNVSIAWIEQNVPYTDRAMPHFVDGMRKAGLE